MWVTLNSGNFLYLSDSISEVNCHDDLAGRFEPHNRRQFFLADIISLQTMSSAVFQLRFRTVAKTLPTGFAVRICAQCSAGKS